MENEVKEVQEAEEVSAAPEVGQAEEVSETTAKEEGAKGPKFYTPEEIEDILANDGKLDENRLSPEGKLLQRSFQRGLGPKLEERSSLKKRLDELEQRVSTQPQQQPATIEEAYQRDPRGTLRYIDNEIRKHQAKIDEDPIGSVKQIEELRNVKDYLRDQELFSTKTELRQRDIASEVEGDIFKEIPDFSKKQQALTDFAVEKLGFTMEEIINQSDPTKVGKSAAKFVSMVNRIYEMENAAKTVQKKEVKTVPKTESAGKGEVDAANSTYAAAFKKAQKTGDWTDVLKLKGAIYASS